VEGSELPGPGEAAGGEDTAILGSSACRVA